VRLAVEKTGQVVSSKSDELTLHYKDILPGLAGLVLLGGSVRPNPLTAASGRPVFDLPLENGRTIMDQWNREATNLARRVSRKPLLVRVVLDRTTPEPALPEPALSERTGGVRFQIERDPFEYRGTGGVISDVLTGYGDDEFILIANAAQVLLEPLSELAQALAAVGADLAILSHSEGTPSGLMLLRAGAVRCLPGIGFVDMKEQGLPLIAKKHRVAVVTRDRTSGLPIRTLPDYIRMLTAYHRQIAGLPLLRSPFEEDWQSTFSIVEDSSVVAPGARLHDSVVLRGGRVGKHSMLVRSLVCPTAAVRKRRVLVDRLVEVSV
jgi:hypothetical protein